MALPGEDDFFASIPGSVNSTPRKNLMQQDKRANVLGHNPFSSMGNDGWNSATKTKQQSPATAFVPLGRTEQPFIISSLTPWQQQHHPQKQPQESLSSVQDATQVPQNAVAPPEGMLLSMSELKRSVTSAPDTATSTPVATPLIDPARGFATTLRIPQPSSADSTISSTGGIRSARSVKRSYISHLLKVDPPDFLKPSTGFMTQPGRSSGRLISQNQSRPLQASHSRGVSRATSVSFISSTVMNTENGIELQKERSGGSPTAPYVSMPNERKDNVSSLSLDKALVGRRNDSDAMGTEASANLIELPRPLKVMDSRGSVQSTKEVLASGRKLPIGSCTANNASFHSSVGEELQFPVSGELNLTHPSISMQAPPYSDGLNTSVVSPIGGVGLKKSSNECSALPTWDGNFSPENLRSHGLNLNGLNAAVSEQQMRPLQPPPPPVAKTTASIPFSINGKQTPAFQVNMLGLLSQPDPHTPYGTDAETHRSLPGRILQRSEMEESPAPVPPSPGCSQGIALATVASTSTSAAPVSADILNPRMFGGVGGGQRPVVGDPPLAQEIAYATDFVSSPAENVVDKVPPSRATASDMGQQDHVNRETDVCPGVEAAFPFDATASAPVMLQTTMTTTRTAPAATTRQWRRGKNVGRCFSLFTSNGYVVTIFNTPRDSSSPSVKSHRFSDMLSKHCEDARPGRVGEFHMKTLQSLISLHPPPHHNAEVPLTALRDAVRGVPNVSPLLQNVLLHMIREPLPEWRVEGRNILVEMLSSAAKQVPISNATHSKNLLASNSAHDAAEGLQRIQQLLCVGDRDGAVEVALEHSLYSHAIIIAMMCAKKERYIEAIRAVVEKELDPFSPLAHAYCIFNEMPPPPFQPPRSSSSLKNEDTSSTPLLRQSWVQHAAVLLSNFTRDSAESLIQLGDALTMEGMIDEAHCCFLMAHLSPMGTPSPDRPIQPKQKHVMDLLRARLGVLSGCYHPQRSRTAFVSPKSTHLTFVLQHIRHHLGSCTSICVGEGGENKPVEHGIPLCPERYMAAFRYMQALWLHEVGLQNEAAALMDVVSRVVPAPSEGLPHCTLNRLFRGGLVAPTVVLPTAAATSSTDNGPNAPLTEDRSQPKPPLDRPPVPLVRNAPPVPSLTPAAGGPSALLNGRRPINAPQPQPQSSQQVAWPPKVEDSTHPGPPKPVFPHGIDATRPGIGVAPLPSGRLNAATGGPLASQPKTSPNSEDDIIGSDTKDNSNGKNALSLESSLPDKSHVPPNLRGLSVEPIKKEQQSTPASRSRSLEAITGFFFRRGVSQDPKKDEAKKMIIDTEKPPQFDPVTGRYLFHETEEEKKMAELVKAGPPKPLSMTEKANATTGGAQAPPVSSSSPSSSMLRPPSSSNPGIGRPSGSGPLRAQYVDVFNS